MQKPMILKPAKTLQQRRFVSLIIKKQTPKPVIEGEGEPASVI